MKGPLGIALALILASQSHALELTGFSPAKAAVGESLVLDGSGFTGSTAVTFNGNAAVFRVVSDARIVAHVPMGSVEGLIEVWKGDESASLPKGIVLDAPTSSVVGWGGQSFQFGKGQTIPPADLTNAIAIAASSSASFAI